MVQEYFKMYLPYLSPKEGITLSEEFISLRMVKIVSILRKFFMVRFSDVLSQDLSEKRTIKTLRRSPALNIFLFEILSNIYGAIYWCALMLDCAALTAAVKLCVTLKYRLLMSHFKKRKALMGVW